MSIEIPPLNSDRLSHPDWGAVPAFDRVALPAARLLIVLEGLPVAAELLDGLRSLALSGASVAVFLDADRRLAQLLLDGRRIVLAGAARDAVLDLLGPPPDSGTTGGSLAKSAAQAPADPSMLARAASIQAQVQESRSLMGRADAATDRAGSSPAALEIAAASLAGSSVTESSIALARAVAYSGLFLEPHLAQWVRGERSLQQIEDETRALPANLRDGEAVDRRASMQIEAMQKQALTLAGQAWEGQTMTLEIERDRERHREAANLGDATGVFVATLTLHLPSLGALRARIRVVENTVGVQIESERAGELQAQLAPLADALKVRGMQLAQLSALAAQGAGR